MEVYLRDVRRNLTKNGDVFEAGDLFVMAKGLSELSTYCYERGAYENSTEYLRLATRVYTEYGDHHSAQECRKKLFELNRERRLKHERASSITNSVMKTIERLHPAELRFKRRDTGVWTATSLGLGKRPTLQFTVERQGADWIVKTSKAVSGHGYVPISFDSASNFKAAKLACERRLAALTDNHEAA